jgi:hypothetical protein
MNQIKQQLDRPVTIQGLIIPVDWDHDGNVTAVAISSYDEIEYLVEKTKKAEELLGLVHMQVEAGGKLRALETKGKLITIEYYRVLSHTGKKM